MRLLTDHFRRLLDFSGREVRGQFWPWTGFVFMLATLGMVGVMVPFMMQAFGKMRQFAAEHPGQATVTQGPGHYSIEIEGSHPELMPDFGPLIIGVGVIGLIAAGLLAAAVARRLHDRGLRGYWGLVPLVLLVTAMVLMSKLFSGGVPSDALFGTAFLVNLTYNVSLLILAVLLAKRSDPGENRFGPPPSD